jgi:hypothetical protein
MNNDEPLAVPLDAWQDAQARDEVPSAGEVSGLQRLFEKPTPAKFDPLQGAVWLGCGGWCAGS